MLRINDIFKLAQDRFRILALSGQHAIWINIDSEKAWPELVRTSTIEKRIFDEELFRTTDPHQELASLSVERGSKAQIIRDQRYDLIAPLLATDDVYYRSGRGQLVQSRSDETGKPRKTLYKNLRQYWQRGAMPNALLPDYRKSGGKGQKKTSKKKLGRPRKISPGTGITADSTIQKMFRLVIDHHYVNDKGNSLAYAHRRFIDMFEAYNPKVRPEDYPTLTQLRYFYHRSMKSGSHSPQVK